MEEKIFSPDIVWLVKLTGISECSPDKSPFAPFAKPINYTNTLFKKPEQLGVPYKERLSNVTTALAKRFEETRNRYNPNETGYSCVC